MRKVLSFGLIVVAVMLAQAGTYEASWESLNTRPCPQWWKDAKFGIFVHWGLYSVPAYAVPDQPADKTYLCYAEWYGARANGAYADYQRRHHPKKSYQDLATDFTAEHFDAKLWAELFRKSGAKYVVLTSKHHEGFALWPSKFTPYFNAMKLGAHRDLCGELLKAVRAEGLRMGFYYSLLEWHNELYQTEVDRFVAEMNLPQMKELVNRYQPDILWPDGEWYYPWQTYRGPEFLAWLYNESPVKDSIVVNDRWGKGMRGKCGDHYTSEYEKGWDVDHPWEECRGIGRSFGYNRMERARHYRTSTELVELLVSLCSRGGNLLLNIGPDGMGQIPVIMEERLLAMGKWLAVNGEAIYGTQAWKNRPKTMAADRIYYTAKGKDVYVIVFKAPEKLVVQAIGAVKSVRILGCLRTIDWRQVGEGVEIQMPAFRLGEIPCEHALTFKIQK